MGEAVLDGFGLSGWDRGQADANAAVKVHAERIGAVLAAYDAEPDVGISDKEKDLFAAARVEAVEFARVLKGPGVDSEAYKLFRMVAGNNKHGLGLVEGLLEVFNTAANNVPLPEYGVDYRSGAFGRWMSKEEHQRRFACAQHLCWGVPCLATLLCIKEFANDEGILEIGSGTGLWAALLERVGARNVHATDEHIEPNVFYAVESCSHIEAVQRYGLGPAKCETLFLCWPHMGPMAMEAVLMFKGKRVVYIGEGPAGCQPGGCTANNEFHEFLDFSAVQYHGKGGKRAGKPTAPEGPWRLAYRLQNPTWPGGYDACYMFERI